MDESPLTSQPIEISESLGPLWTALFEEFLREKSVAAIARRYFVTEYEVREFLAGRIDARVFQRNIIAEKHAASAKSARKAA